MECFVLWESSTTVHTLALYLPWSASTLALSALLSSKSLQFMLGAKYNYVDAIILANKEVISNVTYDNMTWRSRVFCLDDLSQWILRGRYGLRPITHISIKSSWKGEFVVFCISCAPRAVEKIIVNQRRLTRIVLFCYKWGCINSTVKLVQVKVTYFYFCCVVQLWSLASHFLLVWSPQNKVLGTSLWHFSVISKFNLNLRGKCMKNEKSLIENAAEQLEWEQLSPCNLNVHVRLDA